MEEDQISKLVSVLDELFKTENMAGNYQLQNLLAKQQFVRISDLPSFPVVSEITADTNLILEAIKQIPSRVTFNEEENFVLPKIPHHRTTLILRDLPENATLEEVKQLLSSKECGLIKEVRADVNRTWFISFANEEECMKSAIWIQTKAKFRGQSVRCRIKSEHNQKSFFNSHNSNQRFVPPGGSQGSSFPDPAVAYYGPSKGNLPPNPAQRMNYPPAAMMDDFRRRLKTSYHQPPTAGEANMLHISHQTQTSVRITAHMKQQFASHISFPPSRQQLAPHTSLPSRQLAAARAAQQKSRMHHYAHQHHYMNQLAHAQQHQRSAVLNGDPRLRNGDPRLQSSTMRLPQTTNAGAYPSPPRRVAPRYPSGITESVLSSLGDVPKEKYSRETKLPSSNRMFSTPPYISYNKRYQKQHALSVQHPQNKVPSAPPPPPNNVQKVIEEAKLHNAKQISAPSSSNKIDLLFTRAKEMQPEMQDCTAIEKQIIKDHQQQQAKAVKKLKQPVVAKKKQLKINGGGNNVTATTKKEQHEERSSSVSLLAHNLVSGQTRKKRTRFDQLVSNLKKSIDEQEQVKQMEKKLEISDKPLAVSDPGFLEFVNQQLRGPTYEERNQNKPNAHKKKTKIQEAPRNYDEQVDYDGIFKLVNKQTFELVINRFMDNSPDGISPPEALMDERNSCLRTNVPHFNFVVTEDKDEDAVSHSQKIDFSVPVAESTPQLNLKKQLGTYTYSDAYF